MNSLVQADQTWLLWSIILAIAGFGFWAETTKIGLKISGAVITILSGLILSNIGIIPTKAPAYDIVWTYFLPISIPLILFQANIERIVKEAGKTLLGFLVGAAGTMAGAIIGFFLFPLGENAHQLAAAFCAAFIGGTLNFVATAKAINMDSGTLIAAGIASANLVVTAYLIMLFLLPNFRPVKLLLGNNIPEKEYTEVTEKNTTETNASQIIYALTISLLICALGYSVEKAIGWTGTAILTITILSVSLATAFPNFFNRLKIGNELGCVLLQIFFAAIGASASFHAIIEFGPELMLFAAFVLMTHFLFILVGSKCLSLTLYEAMVASNACAAGAPTAAAMAMSLRRAELVLPGILCGTLGYAVGNFVGLLINNILS